MSHLLFIAGIAFVAAVLLPLLAGKLGHSADARRIAKELRRYYGKARRRG